MTAILLRVLARTALLPRALGLVMIAALAIACGCDNGDPANNDNDNDGPGPGDPPVESGPTAEERVTRWMFAIAGANEAAREAALVELETAAADDPAIVQTLLDRIETDPGFTAHVEQALGSGAADNTTQRDDDAVIALDFIRTHTPLPASTLRALVAYTYTTPHLPFPLDGVAQALNAHGLAGVRALEFMTARVTQGTVARQYAAITAKMPWHDRFAFALAHVADADVGLRTRARAVFDALFVHGDASFDRASIEAAIARIATLTRDGIHAGLPQGSMARKEWELIRGAQAWLLERLGAVRITPVIDGEPPGSGRVAWFYPALLKARVEGHYLFFPDEPLRMLAWVEGPKRRDVLDTCRKWMTDNAGKYSGVAGADDAPVDNGGWIAVQTLVNDRMPEHQVMEQGSPRHGYSFTAEAGFEPDAVKERNAAERLAEADEPLNYADWPPAFTPLQMGDIGETEAARWADAVIDADFMAQRRIRDGRVLGDWAAVVAMWCPVVPTVRALAAASDAAEEALLADARTATDWRFQVALDYVLATRGDAAPTSALPRWDDLVPQRWRAIQSIGAHLEWSDKRPLELALPIVGLMTLDRADYDTAVGNGAPERAELLDPVARLIAKLSMVQWQVARFRYISAKTTDFQLTDNPKLPIDEWQLFLDVETKPIKAGRVDAPRCGDFVRFALGPAVMFANRVPLREHADAQPPKLSGYQWRFKDAVNICEEFLGLSDAQLQRDGWREAAARSIRIVGALDREHLQRLTTRPLAQAWLARRVREVRVAALEALPLPSSPAAVLELVAPFLDDRDVTLVDAAAKAMLALSESTGEGDPSAVIDRAAAAVAERARTARDDANIDAASALLQAVGRVNRATPGLAGAMLSLVDPASSSRAESETVRLQVLAALTAWYPRGVGAAAPPTGAPEQAARVRDVAAAIVRETSRSARERALAITTAYHADGFGEISLALVYDALNDTAWAVQDSALRALLQRNNDDDIPALCAVLAKLQDAPTQRDLIDHLATYVAEHTEVVSALLPFLRTKIDSTFTQAQRDAGLGVHAHNALLRSDDPRIGPAIVDAMLNGGFLVIDQPTQSYLHAYPCETAWELFLEVIRGTTNLPGSSPRLAIEFLVDHWDRDVMLDASLELWAETQEVRTLAALTSVIDSVRAAREEAEFRWIRAIAARDYTGVTGGPQPYLADELPFWRIDAQSFETLGERILYHLGGENVVVHDMPSAMELPRDLPPIGPDGITSQTGLKALRSWLARW